eukprot:755525-Hanusia_phi.AAC.1
MKSFLYSRTRLESTRTQTSHTGSSLTQHKDARHPQPGFLPAQRLRDQCYLGDSVSGEACPIKISVIRFLQSVLLVLKNVLSVNHTNYQCASSMAMINDRNYSHLRSAQEVGSKD